MTPEDGSTDGQTFTQRLNHLWETVHPLGKPYTYDQVAEGLSALGYEISVSYLWQLRNGRRENPTLQHIRGLAAFFGVPAAYFLDPEETKRIDEELNVIAAMRDAGVRNVALRTHGLSERDLAALDAMISSLREARGLTDDQPEPDNPGS